MAPPVDRGRLRTSSSMAENSANVRKAHSYEPLMRSPSSDGDSVGGGVRLDVESLSLSPTPEKKNSVQKAATEATSPDANNSSFFHVGNNFEDDDVFTEGSPSETSGPVTPEKGSQVVRTSAPDPIDAQGIYPPTACIFVANLALAYDDETLELEVTRTFSIYGPVFVKIRRDGKMMPFAFCQFTLDRDAQRAEREGKNTAILGRPCRTEMARAHSSFIIYKISGDTITRDEAIELLEEFGEVATANYLDENVRSSYGISQAVVVSYKLYDAKRDVLSVFFDNEIFRVIPFDAKANDGSRAHPRPTLDGRHNLAQYDRDRRSAFLGNLPLDTTEEMLISLGQGCGEVVNVQLFKKQGEFGNVTQICFAFIEFVRPDAPDDMIRSFHGNDMRGYRLKVERKRSRTFETPRHRIYAPRQAPHSLPTYPRHYAGPSSGSDRYSSPLARFNGGTVAGSNGATRAGFTGRSRSGVFAPHGLAGHLGRIFEPLSHIPRSFSSTHVAGSHSSSKDSGPFHSKVTGQAKPETQLPGSSSALAIVSEEEHSENVAPKPAPTKDEIQPAAKESEPPVASQQMEVSQPPLAPPTFPWMQPYPSYSCYPPMSPYMPGPMPGPMPSPMHGPVQTPMTPQSTPGMMYGNYMQFPQFYTPEMYGNMMFSPGAMMPPQGGHIVPINTPTRASHDGKDGRESGKGEDEDETR